MNSPNLSGLLVPIKKTGDLLTRPNKKAKQAVVSMDFNLAVYFIYNVDP